MDKAGGAGVRNMISSVTSRLCEGRCPVCDWAWDREVQKGRGLHCESVPVIIGVPAASGQSLPWGIMADFINQ